MADIDSSYNGRLFAENAVIGSLLIDDDAAPGILGAVETADILNPQNKRVFQAARALMLEGKPVDPVLIREKLGKDIEPHLLAIIESTPTSANWREYAEVMHQQAALAKIRDIAGELTGAVNVDDCREKIAALGELLATGRSIEAWTMTDAMTYFMAAQSATEKPDYITYGLRELDEGTYTERGDVVVIGGEPSSGKTAFALAIAYHMAKTRNVGFFSLETGTRKLADRLVATVTGVDFNAIKRKELTEDDWKAVTDGASDVAAHKLTLIRSGGMTATQIQSVSRSYGFEVIFVDYVQLITPEGDPRAGNAQAMAGVSRALHTFAQTSGTLVVELAQLTRPQKQGGWKEPNMHDLKETGQLEQDADVVMLLYKPKPGTKVHDTEIDPARSRMLKIDKQKEGRLGVFPLYFDGARQRFSVMTNADGRAVMRRFADAGRSASQAARAQSPGQIGLREINPNDPDCPFPKGG